MSKSAVYSWRVDPRLKSALEDAAKLERTSLSRLLDQIASDWLDRQPEDESEEETQNRLHREARKCFGTLTDADPYLAEQSSQRVRQIIREKHARKRFD